MRTEHVLLEAKLFDMHPNLGNLIKNITLYKLNDIPNYLTILDCKWNCVTRQ